MHHLSQNHSPVLRAALLVAPAYLDEPTVLSFAPVIRTGDKSRCHVAAVFILPTKYLNRQ